MAKNQVNQSGALHANDTGSIEFQVVALSARINELSKHFETHAKDFSSKRGLLALISRRKKFLLYLKNNKKTVYAELIEKLGLRR